MTASTPRLAQALDFREECEALHAVLVAAPADAWRSPTQFKGWTFDDVVGHLYLFDHAAELATRGRAEVAPVLAWVRERLVAGTSFQACTREWLAGCAGAALIERWREQYLRLAEAFRDRDPEQRLAWFGPDMSARSFISARQMETWAHGQAIFDTLGLERREHDRLRNVAVMGVNTFGWSYAVRGREPPPQRPYVRLTAPSGATWEWGEPSNVERVAGSAVEFCRVVTQTRNVADTSLRLDGPVAREWLSLAQCFAGPPHPPPAPGTRGPTAAFATP